MKRLICALATCVGLLFWKEIVFGLISLAEAVGIYSYALKTIQIMLTRDSNYIFSSRTDIWNVAAEWISRKTFFGYGVGAFEVKNNVYTHNVFLDIAVPFGITGLVVFVIVLFHSIYKMLHNPCRSYRLFQGLCLGCWLIPMQFSLTMWNVSMFWVYWSLYLYDNKYRRRVNGRNELNACFGALKCNR